MDTRPRGFKDLQNGDRWENTAVSFTVYSRLILKIINYAIMLKHVLLKGLKTHFIKLSFITCGKRSFNNMFPSLIIQS